MHTLKVTLKQHTPLIHFQHDQEGATLRASEVKPKLDKFILGKLSQEERAKGEKEGWIKVKVKDGKSWLDYKMRIETGVPKIQKFWTNRKRLYTGKDAAKDKTRGKKETIVANGAIIENPNSKKNRYVICENGKKYFAKVRKSDKRVIFDLTPYPCFFANMDSDITNFDEYRKMSYTEEPVELEVISKFENLISAIDNAELLCSFFLNYNFGTRQTKGFGSFYIDEEDPHYQTPKSRYTFNLPVEGEYYDDDYRTLFDQLELFTKTIRAGLNVKSGKNTVFYFKSLAFMYCRDRLKSKWDKKCVKTKFYFNDMTNQQNAFTNDEVYDALCFDEGDGYDIRDMLGFSTNEEWQSYGDSIEKKVALGNGSSFPRKTDTLTAERMRSPLLIKPICRVDEDGNISYDIYLLFQDDVVGMDKFKQQKKMCFFSKKKDDENRQMRFMIDIPQDFSMEGYFNYIFNDLQFDISNHVEDKYQDRDEYLILEDIYSQIKENLQ